MDLHEILRMKISKLDLNFLLFLYKKRALWIQSIKPTVEEIESQTFCAVIVLNLLTIICFPST